MAERKDYIASLLRTHETRILSEWVEQQRQAMGSKISVSELRIQCQDFLRLLMEAVQMGESRSLQGSGWDPVKSLLAEVSKARTVQGFATSETATFILSLKRPVFNLLREELGQNPQEFMEQMWDLTTLLDHLGLYTTEVYQRTRDEIIARQQEEMLELSTPVVKLWDGVLALPMIGTLDSTRTQVVMESLLQKIMETESEIAIIDITGVPTVDTLVAQHLIKTVTAARLMGAECIISGIRPQIAATIVHLGVDLGGVSTKASLADAFLLALKKTGRSLAKTPGNRELRT